MKQIVVFRLAKKVFEIVIENLEKEGKMYYCLCKNNSDTYHLFECKKMVDKCDFKSKTSICKKEELNDEYECIFKCENIEEVRQKLAVLAKENQICGICVSTLYKNQDY